MIRFVRFLEQGDLADNTSTDATGDMLEVPNPRSDEPNPQLLSSAPAVHCTPIDEPKIASALDQLHANHRTYLENLGEICSDAASDYPLPNDAESRIRECCSYTEEKMFDECIIGTIKSITIQFSDSVKCDTSDGPDQRDECCALKPEFEHTCEQLKNDLSALLFYDIYNYTKLAEACKWDLKTATLRCREMYATFTRIEKDIKEKIHDRFQVQQIHCDLTGHFVDEVYASVKQNLSALCDMVPRGNPVVPPANEFDLIDW